MLLKEDSFKKNRKGRKKKKSKKFMQISFSNRKKKSG